MTNFEILTQKPFILEEFLEMIVDDALEAKGCSLDLKMPSEEWAGHSWREWLEQEVEELQHPEDTAHARIYDRLLEMCCPVCITGENIRKATAQGKMERLKGLMNGKESL